eukprot:4229936-Prymnesium_polylepis.1
MHTIAGVEPRQHKSISSSSSGLAALSSSGATSPKSPVASSALVGAWSASEATPAVAVAVVNRPTGTPALRSVSALARRVTWFSRKLRRAARRRRRPRPSPRSPPASPATARCCGGLPRSRRPRGGRRRPTGRNARRCAASRGWRGARPASRAARRPARAAPRATTRRASGS